MKISQSAMPMPLTEQTMFRLFVFCKLLSVTLMLFKLHNKSACVRSFILSVCVRERQREHNVCVHVCVREFIWKRGCVGECEGASVHVCEFMWKRVRVRVSEMRQRYTTVRSSRKYKRGYQKLLERRQRDRGCFISFEGEKERERIREIWKDKVCLKLCVCSCERERERDREGEIFWNGENDCCIEKWEWGRRKHVITELKLNNELEREREREKGRCKRESKWERLRKYQRWYGP